MTKYKTVKVPIDLHKLIRMEAVETDRTVQVVIYSILSGYYSYDDDDEWDKGIVAAAKAVKDWRKQRKAKKK